MFGDQIGSTEWIAGAGVVLSLLMTGCARDAKPAVVANHDIAPTPMLERPSSAPAERTSIEISESVRQKCNLPDSPREAPQFDYDEAQLRPRGEGILDSLARCLEEGNMKGQSVTVIGHADPRGSEEYNFALGQERASAAADYLKSHGVPASQIWVESRGELDATGGNEQEWQLDRNVQIAEK